MVPEESSDGTEFRDLTDLVEASAERLEVMRQEASAIDASVLMRYIRFSQIFQVRCAFNTEACVGRGGIDQAPAIRPWNEIWMRS